MSDAAFGEKVWKFMQGRRLRAGERELLHRCVRALEPRGDGAAAIEQGVERLAFLDGEELVAQGDVDHALYFLLDGKLDVLVDGKVVERLVAGEVFGEIGLLTGAARSATIRADGRCIAVRVPTEAIDDTIRERLWVYAAARRFKNLHNLPTRDADELRVWYADARHIRLAVGSWDTGAPWVYVYSGTVAINGKEYKAPALAAGGKLFVEEPSRVALLPALHPDEEEDDWDPSTEDFGDSLGTLDPPTSEHEPADLGRFR